MKTMLIGVGIIICIAVVILGMSCIIVGSRSEREFRENVVEKI